MASSRAPEREILERTVRAIADRARDAYRLVEEAHEVDPATTRASLRQRSVCGWSSSARRASSSESSGRLLLNCQRCRRRVHWVPGVGPEPGHWGHAEAAPIGHRPEV